MAQLRGDLEQYNSDLSKQWRAAPQTDVQKRLHTRITQRLGPCPVIQQALHLMAGKAPAAEVAERRSGRNLAKRSDVVIASEDDDDNDSVYEAPVAKPTGT